MHILHLDCAAMEKDTLIAELHGRGTLGIVERDGGLDAYFDAPFDAAEFAAHDPQWEAAVDRDWVEVARSQWEAFPVGERFFLVPEWSAEPAPPGRLRLAMRPGRACGTGWHAATQAALAAMERWVRPGSAILDLGAGSGILSTAAALLGAGAIYACDIEFDSAAVAREHLESEGVRAGVFAGSVRSVRARTVDTVVANINAEVVIELEPEIRRALKPGGRAILSGFPERHLARVRRAWGAGLDAFEKDGWIALVC